MSDQRLPTAKSDQNYVELSMFSGGFITLPEKSFVFPSDADAKRQVPSMAFLITHPGLMSTSTRREKPIRIMFDMGLRSDIMRYTGNQRAHFQNRIPYSLGRSIASQLQQEGLNPTTDIDMIILSHVHYDHHGDPQDFVGAKFIVGSGSCGVLKNGLTGAGSHQHFQSDLLPPDRTFELPSTNDPHGSFPSPLPGAEVKGRWSPLGPFPSAMDLIGDGSIYIVDSPGHLPGHLNLLCRVGSRSWIYLGGDSCHDIRLLTGEKEISTWDDGDGNVLCIHLDRVSAKETIDRIAQLSKIPDHDVQIIMAHDWLWYEKNKHAGFPGRIPV
ncbi:unnamed protein product [Aureobasidium pullulans]|uniref:Metallo-hydrolase/oxidoreductase n=1 Tax=Aureobasidium pullulans TaxID=5580 RepID=A0A4S8X9U8_AURPU|nr:hypothetical protein D6D22_08697 [Aureobasidium pullulans]CAC9889525.1 unnamed protein product [Aureobasidium pullulans]